MCVFRNVFQIFIESLEDKIESWKIEKLMRNGWEKFRKLKENNTSEMKKKKRTGQA